MRIKVYSCQYCKTEFRYYKKIISCAVCGSLDSIVEKYATMNKKRAIKVIEDVKIAYEANNSNQMVLRLDDVIKYLNTIK